MLNCKFLDTHEAYDGSQLASLRGYMTHGVLGHSLLAWVGPCHVTPEHMVDGEDLLAGAEIRGDMMLHFIIEHFAWDLFTAVTVQRMFAVLTREELLASAVNKVLAGRLERVGDDLFADGKKLSISIATKSPVSALIHFAVNVTNKGTPVPTLSLQDFGVDPKGFAEALFKRVNRELDDILAATCKVRWVR